jgi:hypothetical protein
MKKSIVIAALLSCCNCAQTNCSSEATTDTVATAAEQMSMSKSLVAFEIMSTEFNKLVDNYYLLIPAKHRSPDSLQIFIDTFRDEYCQQKCNIYLYDDKSVHSLVSKYPLGDREYLHVADHFIASSTFDDTDVWMYPFRDAKYKQLGGKAGR